MAIPTGPQKAAMIITILGEDIASDVLKHLTPEETRRVVSEIAKLDYIPPESIEKVSREFQRLLESGFSKGGKETADNLMNRVLGKQSSMTASMDELTEKGDKEALEVLQDADPYTILQNIKNDQPQTIAIILRNLSPAKSSRILRGLTPEAQEGVIRRMAQLETPSPEIISEIARTLKSKLMVASSTDDIRKLSGVGIASTIVSYIGGKEANEILKGIEKVDPITADRMKDLIFTFDDLANLDNRSMQKVVREVEMEDLVKCFKAASDKIKDKILSSMSEHAREELMEEFETLGPVRLSEVEEAQRKVVEVVRKLDEAGEISIIREEDKL